MKRFSLVSRYFFTVLLLFVFTGCTTISEPLLDTPSFPMPEPPDFSPPDLDFTLGYYPQESFHPTLVQNETNQILAPLLYQSLYQLDENMNPQPVLVTESQVSQDGYRWVFTLREDVTLWNGTALTASMVVSALNEARGSSSFYAPRFAQIFSITASGNQLTIALTQPNANLPALLDIPISYGGGSVPQGTGPYVYLEEQSILSLQPTWEGLGYPQEIQLKVLEQPGDLVAGFDSGELSLLPKNLTATNQTSNTSNYQVWQYATSQLWYLGFHSDALSTQVRTLIHQALNRQSLID